MPCFYPLQAYFSVRSDGKKDLRFSDVLAENFRAGCKLPDDCISLPCGQCMFCRLERSRETALRCVHESKMFEDSVFLTLTYSQECLEKECPFELGGYSLVRKHAQDFVKRLRERFDRGFNYVLSDGVERFYKSDFLRVFGCGEYGDRNGRPHFHFCVFNCCFPDRKLEGCRDGFSYYSSALLESLWTYGRSVVCDFSFETAAYVARYVTKKVTGKMAADHYAGRLPEFPIYPTRGGGLGKLWFEKYGRSDVVPTDTCIVRGVKCKPPRYYDRLRARGDSEGLLKAKLVRSERARIRVDDNSYARLRDKEKCMDAKIRCLVRRLEK